MSYSMGLSIGKLRDDIKKKINVEKMRMLRWMNSNTLEDQITNEIILGKLDLTP